MTSEGALERLLTAMRQDAEARSREFRHLNEQLEQRNELFEAQLGKRANSAKWLAILAAFLAITAGALVYTLVLTLGNDVKQMSGNMVDMRGYLRNMAAGDPVDGEASFMSSMAHDIHRMSNDIAAMRVEMTAVSGDIGVMRTAMTDMREDIGAMNSSMGEMGGDMKDMRANIDGMAQSLGHMSRSVGRLSRDAQHLREPFRGIMPW